MGKIKIATRLPGPKARKVMGLMKRNCYDSTFTYPLVVSNGKGSVIVDVDGNRYLDFTSNIGSCPLGYSHPAILQVLSRYSKNGAHKIAGQDFYCEEHAALSADLLSIFPKGFKSFFINTGAEAVENSIKIAWRKTSFETPSRLPGISCINAFHGRTIGALTFTFSKPVQKFHMPELPVLRIKFCTRDDDPAVEDCEKILAERKAAFILVEVIQGEGGYNFASKKFIQKLRTLADSHEVPLILDEVQSGMGRTGRWWAFEHYGVEPDIVPVAKALQVGAVGYRAELDPGERGALSSTWGGGARIDLAVGSAIIKAIKKERLLQNACRMGEKLVQGLKELAASGVGERAIVEVRGIGLMVGIEFASKEIRDEVLAKSFKKGLLLLPAGQKSMRVIPPLIVDKEEIEEATGILGESLR
ncbi:MAG: aminotransferase class III-fold pyridoxal phosphate-dependent enzyme [Nitrososphaera sp.]